MKTNTIPISAINSFLITQFLFFIDEGYYDFRWMSSGGNWLIFVIYFAILFGILLLINRILKKVTPNNGILLGINLVIFPLILMAIFSNM